MEKLDIETSIKKTQLNKLYNAAKKGEDTWGEIDKLRQEIKLLSRNLSLNADKLIILTTLQKYTKEGENGEVIIDRESLPKIENIDFQVAKALNAMEMLGEERMRKETKLDKLYTEARQGKDVWNEIEKLENEIEELDKEYWEKREEWLRLRILQNIAHSVKIGGKTIIPQSAIVSTHPVSKSQNLTLLIEKENETLENMSREIARKKNRLKELCSIVKEGEDEDIWDEIMSLRLEIKKLKSEYEYKRERYFELKMLEEFTES